MKFGRRAFLKATACVPALATIQFGLVERPKPEIAHLKTHWWGGKVEVCTSNLPDIPGSHVTFSDMLPFDGSFVSLEVVPKKRWWKQDGIWISKSGRKHKPIEAEVQLCFGPVASELPALMLPIRPQERFWFPIFIKSGERVTFRMKDNSPQITKYDVHAAISETV